MNVPEQIVAALRALANTQQLRQQAEESCRTYMKNCAADGDMEGWLPDEIEVRFQRYALVFDHESLKYPFIETRMGLYDGALPIGHYRLITLLDGTAIDDYLVIDQEKK